MVIEIAFVACLIAAPDTCREERLLFADVPIMVCVTGAQAQLALWARDRPEWQVTSYRCGFYDPSRASL